MQNRSGTGLSVPVRECRRATLTTPVCDSGHRLEVDVCGHNPECLAVFLFLENPIEVVPMPNPL